MTDANSAARTLATSRLINAAPAAIFAAMRDPARLARWWGPDGFTNTFDTFEFRPGGAWNFTMHGPNGANYPNQSSFAEIVPDQRLVIRHACEPYFTLTITLTPREGKTFLEWSQCFDSAAVCANVASIVIPSNEQNLNRLEAELARPG